MQVAATAAEKMDAIYGRQRYIYDATRRYYLLGRDRLIGSLKPPLGGVVLEVGCGTARNLIRAAKRYPDARFYGIDISEAMLKSARASVARRGLRSRVTLGQGDATAFQTGLAIRAGRLRPYLYFLFAVDDPAVAGRP